LQPFENEQPPEAMPNFPVLVIGLSTSREKIKENIHLRLKNRINEGLIEEVEELIKKGVTHEQLNYYGLEYRYVSQYLTAKIDKDELFAELYKAICNYAKRQMTWYRRMEKKGTIIHWVDANDTLDSQIVNVMNIIKSKLNV
jgi:tRNA dimethylallyltransferase